MQKRFTQQFAVGGVAQVIDLATGPFIGENFQDLQRNGYRDLFDLLAFFTVFSVRADILAVPLSHGTP
ncbi:hypothetical protein D3C87_1903780 [compost metagenome]